jgi:hypothetical protein
MSAFPSGADILGYALQVCLGPEAEVSEQSFDYLVRKRHKMWDQLDNDQSITSSASICIEIGTSMPSAFAVFRLMDGSARPWCLG